MFGKRGTLNSKFLGRVGRVAKNTPGVRHQDPWGNWQIKGGRDRQPLEQLARQGAEFTKNILRVKSTSRNQQNTENWCNVTRNKAVELQFVSVVSLNFHSQANLLFSFQVNEKFEFNHFIELAESSVKIGIF